MRVLDKGFQKLKALPEWLYLREAKLGDREAFGKLYQLYVDKMYRFCYFRVGQKREDAEDLTADIFLKAWRKLDTFTNGSFQAWLYMIARNTVIDFYRGKKVHVPLSEEFIDEKPSILEVVSTSLEVARIKKAMRKLTDDQQELLLLKFVEDMSNQEIARILEKSEEAIRAMQHRAIKSLQEELGDEK